MIDAFKDNKIHGKIYGFLQLFPNFIGFYTNLSAN